MDKQDPPFSVYITPDKTVGVALGHTTVEQVDSAVNLTPDEARELAAALQGAAATVTKSL